MNKAAISIVSIALFIAAHGTCTAAGCDPATSNTSCAGKDCDAVGTTIADKYQTEILACLYNSTDVSTRKLFWISTTGSKGIGRLTKVFNVGQDWPMSNGLAKNELLDPPAGVAKFNVCLLTNVNMYRHGDNYAGGQLCKLTLDSSGNYTLSALGASGNTGAFQFTTGGAASTVCEATCYYD